MEDLARALDFFQTRDDFVLTTHEGPDADGLGSEIVVYRTLKALGKKVVVLNSDPLPDRYAFLDPERCIQRYDERIHGAAMPGSALVVLDTADPHNLGALSDSAVVEAGSVFALDHHEAAAEKESLQGFLDAGASSTCEIVTALAAGLGAALDPIMARAAYAGILYDTGSFIYPKTKASTFRTALCLVEAGAVPTEIHRAMYESASVGSLLLQKLVMATLELHEGNRIALQNMAKSDLHLAGALYEEAEPLINIPLRSRDVEVSIFFKESEEGKLRCSLRSKGAVNVSAIAQSFGGGGHKTAAGFKCSKGLAETKSEVLKKTVAALRAASTGVR